MICKILIGAVFIFFVSVSVSTLPAQQNPVSAKMPLLRCDFDPSPIARFDEQMKAIRTRNGIELQQLAEDEKLAIRFARSEARPQDRWLVGAIEIRPQVNGEWTGVKLDVALYAIGESQPRARLELAPTSGKGRIEVDLRRAKLARARVVVRLLVNDEMTAAAEVMVSAQATPQLAQGWKVPIQLDVPQGVEANQPRALNFGVPFAPGALWEVAGLRLVDASGKALPSQVEITARWAREGSIQWLRCDTVAAPANGIFLERATGPLVAESALRIEASGEQVLVHTGAATYTLTRGSSPIAAVQVDGKNIVSSEGVKGLFVTDQTGRVATAAAKGETMEIESRGPVAACVRFEGDYRTADGQRLARHITRLEFYAGQVEAKIQHTLVLTENSNQVSFTDIGWELAVDAGSDAEACFAISREDPSQFVRAKPGGPANPAWLLQDRHFRFQHGENHFSVNASNDVLHEGEECGDWFSLRGKNGGLGWSCRDTAWQHPKEFEAKPDRMTLHLWSSRSGEKLDFSMSSLIERWDLAGWLAKVAVRRDVAKIPQLVEQAQAIEHNAVGWAKTHELLLRPLTANSEPEVMGAASAAHSHPVLALADPGWLYQSQAMGPLHPRDAETFPELEAAIDGASAWWHGRIHAWGEYGFGDYYAGPHLSYIGDFPAYKRYHWATYGLRPGLWMLYGRSGDRGIFELASKNNQSFMDNHFAHWDGDGKVRGLFLGISSGGDEPARPATLPLYWQGGSAGNINSSTDLNQFLRDYYLTGNRRARDVVEQYGHAAGKIWSPKTLQGSWRPLMDYRCLAQCYALDWDPALGAMVEATLEIISDDDSVVGLTKDRSYNASTYKTQADFGGLADAAEILGTPRAYEVVRKVARYQAPLQFGSSPLGYNSPVGRVGHFLYEETGDASIAEAMALQLRWLSSQWDRERNAFRYGADNAAGMLFLTQGAAYAQDVVSRAGGWERAATSWTGAEIVDGSASFVVNKPDRSSVTLWLRRPRDGDPGDVGGKVSVQVLNAPNAWGADLNRVDSDSYRNTKIFLPKDAPPAAYRISTSGDGPQLLRADSRVPLVLHAPGYWQPAPPQDPPLRWFFRVPENAEGAAIFFEGTAKLFDPSGQLFPNAAPSKGWISLPGGRPGLWSFELQQPKLVRVRNLPPFFALRDPAFYFEPPIPWERESGGEFTPPDPSDVYVEGALAPTGNQALQLTGKRRLIIEDGAALPFEQGTIEFWYRPNYNTLELNEGGGLLSLGTREDSSWNLSLVQGNGSEWFQSRSLLGSFDTDGASKRRNIRCYRRTLFESGRWVHVAWTWGVRHDLSTRGGRAALKAAEQGVLIQRIYIDGKAGKFTPDNIAGNRPLFAPIRLRTSSAVDGAIDELRISRVMRYRDDFELPTRKRPFEVDEDTLGLWHFDGNLTGESAVGPVTAEFR